VLVGPKRTDRTRSGADAETDEVPFVHSSPTLPARSDDEHPPYDDAADRTETNITSPISTREGLRPTLTVLVGMEPGRVLDCGPITLIGRAKDCDLVLGDTGVSRHHARLVRNGTAFVVEDLGSKNRTFVNSRRVDSGELRHGDELQIGPNVTLRFAFLGEAEERLARQLYESSMRDALTGAYNRRYLEERLGTEVAFALRHKTALSLVMFDFDHFKRLNDTYGHAAGDAVLSNCSRVALQVLRTEDVLARIGGEEFVVLLRGISHADALVCAERLRSAVEGTPIAFGRETIRATISLGVASFDEAGSPPSREALLEIADHRLYAAKAAGRNRAQGR
jgi:diguanylate cyclase (GGDEF)-like protein